MVAGRVDDLESGVALAAESLDSGRAVRRARRAGRYVARRAAPADGLTRQARRGACAAGSRAGESGPAQRDDAPAEAAAGHAGAEDPGLRQQVLDQLVDRRHGDPVVDRQAAVPLGHEGAEGDSGCRRPRSRSASRTRAHSVTTWRARRRSTGSTSALEVAELAAAERPAEEVGGPLALGAPRGVGRAREEAGDLAVHDDERRVGGKRDVARSRGWRSRCAGRGRRWRRRSSAGRAGPRAPPRRARPPGSRGRAPAGRGRGRARAGARPRRRRSTTGRPRPGACWSPGRLPPRAVVGAAGARPPGRPRAEPGRSSPRAISTGWSGNWSESIPTRKLPGLGVKVTSVARSMAMGSESPPL